MPQLTEVPGADAWALHGAGGWVVIPTNTTRRANGTAVMGAGLARQAADRYPDLPGRYGRSLAKGVERLVVNEHRLLLTPTKTNWRRPALWSLVEEAGSALRRWCAAHPQETLVVPALGCGLGGLDWSAVRPMLVGQLQDHNVILIPPRG